MEPCAQRERLTTLEMILKNMSDTLHEQKQLGTKTYEVLADISEQGAQIKSLTGRLDTSEKDIEEMFKRTRKVEDKVIEHTSFISNYEKDSSNRRSITAPVFSGLLIAVIVAIVTFGIVMVDRHNYTQPAGQESGK